ncbi:B12-binding domain-containing radical SAM protein [Wukongibacter sp. M2B1]|uniref:B12-binding domain-containing radical SAM protein n=1 Tax=Wukongibacter sp. M2B1 TaxID=3088895 RepID=UPI003D78FDB0
MKRMRILLFALYCDGMWEVHEEIGICYITAYLRERGYEVILKSIGIDSLNYSEITELAPDVIGIPVYDANKMGVYEACIELRKLLPDTIICIGGSVPTCYGKDVLVECPEVDIAIKGEGEHTFYEMLLKLESGDSLDGVKGIIFRKGREIAENAVRPLIENMDSLPFPARDMLEEKNIKVAQISTSRGCTARCSFCASKLYWTRWRGRSVENVVDEIQHIINKHGIRAFNFIDGSFEDPGNDFKRIYSIAKGILDSGLTISYYVHMRAEFFKMVSPDLIETLKKSGLVTACIGLESANEEDLRLYNKNASIDDMEKAIDVLKQYDINLDPGFINFNPYSTFDKLKKNIDFLEKHGFAANPDYIIKSSRIYRGTTLYRKTSSDNLMRNKEIYECGFIFSDPRIKELYEYTFLYLKGEDPSNVSIFRAICHGSSFNNVGISCMKKLFLNHSLIEAYEIMREYEIECKNIGSSVNKSNSIWFRNIIKLAEEGWDSRKADEISNKYLSKEYLKDIARGFQYQNERLRSRLFKLDLKKEFLDLQKFILQY